MYLLSIVPSQDTATVLPPNSNETAWSDSDLLGSRHGGRNRVDLLTACACCLSQNRRRVITLRELLHNRQKMIAAIAKGICGADFRHRCQEPVSGEGHTVLLAAWGNGILSPTIRGNCEEVPVQSQVHTPAHHLRFHVPHAHLGAVFGESTFGRLAEAFARFFGTPTFIIGQTIIVLTWIAINAAVLTLRWDPYPFILLNLVFSTQAAYAAPLILLAQTRQADRDKAWSDADARHREDLSERTLTLLQQNTDLTQKVEELSERLHQLTEEIHRKVVMS
jgi:uncharacterized membrane protein